MSKQSSKSSQSEPKSAQSDHKSTHSESFMQDYVVQDGVTLTSDKFGAVVDPASKSLEIVKRYTWNAGKTTVQVISYGATITKIETPDAKGHVEDIVMGFEDMSGYTDANNPNMGCTVGRVANRIGRGTFFLNGKERKVDLNLEGKHHLHGGFVGWGRKNWHSTVDGVKVRMTLLSPDGDSGYPGAVLATATFYLTPDNQFFIEYQAVSTEPTIVNMTSHPYFNLAGHASGAEEVYRHILTINADKITATDKDYIPTGELLCVGGSAHDFRSPKELGPALARVKCNAFDENFCVQKGGLQKLAFVARAWHPKSGRFLEISSNQPGVQFYTSNFLPNPDGKVNPLKSFEKTHEYHQGLHDEPEVEVVSMEKGSSSSDMSASTCECASDVTEFSVVGKGGANYEKHGAFCLETQNWPDAINHPNFPSPVLLPGETYFNQTILHFGVQKHLSCEK